MPSVASQVNASINQHRDAKPSASANGNDRGSSSPFEEMLDSAVAAEDPAPSTKNTSPAKASNGNTATQGKNTKSADDAPPRDDAASPQVDDVARDETTERNDAKLADLVGKALLADAGENAPPLQPEIVEETPPAEKPIVEIGLAAFLEAVASATSPQPKAEDATDEPSKAEGDAQGDAEAQAGVAAVPVKADVVAAVVATVTAEAAADVAAQPAPVTSTPGATITPAVGTAQALPQAAPVEHGLKNPGEAVPTDAEATDLAADVLAAQAEAPKPHAEAQKHRAETTAHSDSKLQPAEADTSKKDAAPPVRPDTAASQSTHVTHRHTEAADAKPAKASVNAAETPAPTKPVDVPQTLQTLPQMTTPTVAATQSASVLKEVAPPAATVPIEGVAVEIAAKASEGMKSFEIRLDPPELGRIHVRLDVDRNGELTSRVTADRQDTLDLLRRDAPQLERALNDAGLRTSNNGLQFSLRDQGQGQHQQQQPLPQATRLIVPDDSLAAELTQRGYYRPAGSAGGIDIRV